MSTKVTVKICFLLDRNNTEIRRFDVSHIDVVLESLQTLREMIPIFDCRLS